MFLKKDEKVLLLLYRIEIERMKTLFGYYKSYSIGEKKIERMQKKIIRLGGVPNAKIIIE